MRNRARPMLTTLIAGSLLIADAAAQTAPRPPAPAANDFVEAFNESEATARLEFVPAGPPARRGMRPNAMACIPPKKPARLALDGTLTSGTLRLQMMQGDRCDEDQKDTCRSETHRAAGMSYFKVVRGAGQQCGVVPAPPPARGQLQAAGDCGPSGAWAPLVVHNKHSRNAIWVTFHSPGGAVAACWAANEKRFACVDRAKITAQMQVVESASDCSARSICNTGHEPRDNAFRVDMAQWPNGYLISSFTHGCRWE